ncbi:TlpA family protein disulfide reductase [Desulfotomaculum copahuensis]|uniref:Peroxiredoxin n=1 Tax=Desulfotomaculum copahuensis TaxID=1838280 RepID=A0A1B7LAT2_9FIRM|nr:TlpA disulfide reductase family protein [Desulfotomaculum copahuensis]OAT79406.1 peroxiredoxin [Desulfotomaculum copahuensis]
MKKKFILAGLIILTITLLAAGCQPAGKQKTGAAAPQGQTGAPKTGTAVGEQAPDFTLGTIDGKKISLSSFRGRPVMLNFWATWCPPCQEEMPEIEKFYRQNGGKIQLLAVNLTANEKSTDQVKQFLQSGGYTFPVLLDQNGDLARQYMIRYIPTSMFIDSGGIIRFAHTGPMTMQMLQEGLNKVKK